MDVYSFPPIAAVIDTAYTLAVALVDLLTPVMGVHSAAVGVILITVVVRTALIPAARARVRAENVRRTLAPALAELQRRYRTHPEVLHRKTAELFANNGTSPFAGIVPTLAQAPVVSTVYALFLLGSINGHPNTLLDATLFQVPLGTSLLHLLGTAPAWPAGAVFAGVLATIAAVAMLTRRASLREASGITPHGASGGLPSVVSWLPLLIVGFAALVPLAAALYLAVSTMWTLVERNILRRKL